MNNNTLEKIYNDFVNNNFIKYDKKQIEVLKKIEFIYTTNKKIRIFSKTKKFNGIYLHGSVGTGKTFILNLFIQNIKKAKKIHFNHFMINLHAYINNNKNNSALENYIKDYAKNYSIIFIDELHIFNIVDALLIKKIFIFFEKYKIFIIISSNFHPDELYKNGLQRNDFLPFIEFIKKDFAIIYLQNLIEPIDPRDAKNISREKIIYLCTGSQGEPMGAMNRIVNDIHPDVYLEAGDTVIFSSKIIPGNEKKLYHLQNMITKNNVEIITEENAFVHVSGHPNRDDLKDMYNWVKPKCIIPVHGEHRHMKEHVDFAKKMQIPQTLLIENGDIVRISPGEHPKIIDKAPSGKIFVDGKIPVYEDAKSIKDRKNLSLNGYLEITLIITNNGNFKKPVISYKGIPETELEDNLIFDMEDEIVNTCKTFSLKSKNQEKNLIESLKHSCRKIIKNKTGKKPLTNINIARI